MESSKPYVNDLNFKATELRLGLPGSDESQERAPFSGRKRKRPLTNIHDCESKNNSDAQQADQESAPPAKEQIVGWPPIRSYRKNSFQPKKSEADPSGIYVKVNMDGAPYLRKIDLKVYQGYPEFLKALESMFNFTIGAYFEGEGYKGSEYAPTYEDKDGDWMLAGDVPWSMFISSCKKLRIMKGSEVKGLASGV